MVNRSGLDGFENQVDTSSVPCYLIDTYYPKYIICCSETGTTRWEKITFNPVLQFECAELSISRYLLIIILKLTAIFSFYPAM
jgi:hypothetical protein